MGGPLVGDLSFIAANLLGDAGVDAFRTLTGLDRGVLMYAPGPLTVRTPNDQNSPVTLTTATISAAKLVPGACLRVTGLLDMPTALGGRVVKLLVNGNQIAQSFPETTMQSLHFEHIIQVANNLKSVVYWTSFMNAYQSPDTTTNAITGSSGGTSGGFAMTTAPIPPTNSQSDISAFATPIRNDVETLIARYNATRQRIPNGVPFGCNATGVTTTTIDLTGGLTITLTVAAQNGDTYTMQYLLVEQLLSQFAASRGFAPPKALAIYGDSLTAGTGASAGNTISRVGGGYPNYIRNNNRGIVINNYGVGGEKISQIVDRMVADKTQGKFINVIIDGGRNDVGTGTWSGVFTEIARGVANLDPSSNYLIGGIISAANEPPGSANYIQIAGAGGNAGLKALYGTKFIDTHGALTSGSYTTATFTSGNNTITVASATNWDIGNLVYGPGIPLGTTITNVVSTTVTLSQNVTADGSGVGVVTASASGETKVMPIAYRATSATTTGTFTDGSPTVTVASATGLAIGQFVTGSRVQDQTKISNIVGTTVTMDKNAVGSGGGLSFSAVGAGEVHLNDTGYTIKAIVAQAVLVANSMV